MPALFILWKFPGWKVRTAFFFFAEVKVALLYFHFLRSDGITFGKISDFPKGGDVQATRAWLDLKGFQGVFENWEADALLGKPDEFIRRKFPSSVEGQERAEMLCGFLNTARQTTGEITNLLISLC